MYMNDAVQYSTQHKTTEGNIYFFETFVGFT